jgi:hypothetical protein
MSWKRGLILLLLVLPIIAVLGRGDECQKCAELEKAQYNVYFWFPGNDKDYYLGETTGLSTCGSVAHAYASKKDVLRSNWSYICCLKTSSSGCEEKHL